MPSPIAKITDALVTLHKFRVAQRKEQRKEEDRQFKETLAAEKSQTKFLEQVLSKEKRKTDVAQTERRTAETRTRSDRLRGERLARRRAEKGETAVIAAEKAGVDPRGKSRRQLAREAGTKKRLLATRGKAAPQIRKLKEREEEFKRLGGDPRVAKTMTSSQLRSGIKRMKKVASDADKLAKAKAAHVKEVDKLVTTDKTTGEQFVDITEVRRVHLRKRQERLFPDEPVPRAIWTAEEGRSYEDKLAALGPEPGGIRDKLGALLANVPGFGGAVADEGEFRRRVEELERTHVVAPRATGGPSQKSQAPQARGTKRLLGRKGVARQANGKTAKGSKPLVRRTKRAEPRSQPSKAPSEMTDQEILNALGVR